MAISAPSDSTMSDLSQFAAAGKKIPVNFIVKMNRCVVKAEELQDFRECAIGHRKGDFVCVGTKRDTVNTDPYGTVVITWFLGLMPKEGSPNR